MNFADAKNDKPILSSLSDNPLRTSTKKYWREATLQNAMAIVESEPATFLVRLIYKKHEPTWKMQ